MAAAHREGGPPSSRSNQQSCRALGAFPFSCISTRSRVNSPNLSRWTSRATDFRGVGRDTRPPVATISDSRLQIACSGAHHDFRSQQEERGTTRNGTQSVPFDNSYFKEPLRSAVKYNCNCTAEPVKLPLLIQLWQLTLSSLCHGAYGNITFA